MAQTQDLKKLPENPSAEQVVSWLNGFNPNPKKPDKEVMKHIGNELLSKVIGKDWQDGLKPYATMRQKGVSGPRVDKYPILKKKDNKAWDEAKQAFIDRDSMFYVETLIHQAAIDRLLSVQKEPPLMVHFNDTLALALELTYKTISPEPTVLVEAAINKANAQDKGAIIEDTKKAIEAKLQERIAKAKDTRALKKSQPIAQQVIVERQSVQVVNIKALEVILKKVQGSESAMRKMTRQMENVLSDLITEIKAAIKVGK